MSTPRAWSRRSWRSYQPLTIAHLDRLAAIADQDYAFFTRPAGRPEYAGRRVLVVLAQGSAKHWVDRSNGVKDLDVWTFYAALPGQDFPCPKRNRHAGFGASALGRERLDLTHAPNEQVAAWMRSWERYAGRRVDLLVRDLPVSPRVRTGTAVAALQAWLEKGAEIPLGPKAPSAAHLARKPVVLLGPGGTRGEVIWRPREPAASGGSSRHVRP